MANVKVWFAKNATVKLLSGGTVFPSGTALTTVFSSGSAIEGVMKDITITEPVGDVDKIDLMGTTSSFQNAEIEEKPAPLGEITGTIVIPGTPAYQSAINTLYGSGTTAPSGYSRFKPGLATRIQNGILLSMSDGTDEVAVGVQYAYTTTKDIKLTGADGHFEGSFTAKFLPRDYVIDFK